ncbi:MAG: SUMF1/EgtB/PvdO family nonheme iron enzyme [Blastocatellia bacterium]
MNSAPERWTDEERLRAIDAFFESEEGRRFLDVFSLDCSADEDREIFLRDAERRQRSENEAAANWWRSLRALVRAVPAQELTLAEPLSQIGVDLEEIYESLPEQFDPSALVQAILQVRSAQTGGLAPGISNTSDWSEAQILNRLEEVRATLDLESASEQARKWWDAFEQENDHRKALILRLVEELANRSATVPEFFEAYVYSNTENIQANLHYLDYMRWKRRGKEPNESPPRSGLSTDGSGWWLKPAQAITRVRGWTEDQIRTRLMEVKSRVESEEATDQIRAWWDAFERESHSRPALVLRVVEELIHRNVTLAGFFHAYEKSGVEEIRAILDYLDYSRLKTKQEKEKADEESQREERRQRKKLQTRNREKRTARARKLFKKLAPMLGSEQPMRELSAEENAALLYLPRAEAPVTVREGIDRAIRSFPYETITLDEAGEVTERRQSKAGRLIEELVPGVVLELVEIPGGAFNMGSADSEGADDERPRHEVAVSPFSMGRFPVTQEQWEIVAGWEKVEIELDPDPSKFKGDDRPVETVSWLDAVEFCARLSRNTGRAYRLPTEAEWEYACRAGTTTPFAFGETIAPEIVNYNGDFPYSKAKKGEFRAQTVPAGSLGVANSFGLFDMHGNVWEWCSDKYGENYYRECHERGVIVDPQGPGAGSYRVIRGGGWHYYAVDCRSADRFNADPGARNDYVGLRLVRAGRIA